MKKKWQVRQISLGNAIILSFVTLVIGFIVGMNWNHLFLQFSPYINPKQKVSTPMKWDELNEVYSQLSSNFDGSLDKANLITPIARTEKINPCSIIVITKFNSNPPN